VQASGFVGLLVQARRPAALLFVLASLSGCMSGGLDATQAEVDQKAMTGSLPSGQPADPTRVSDETTIRNAVSAADPEAAQVQPLAWANAETGSRGAISKLEERNEDGTLCRRFTASRESFDGVALFSGDACKGDRGVWYMRDFKPL
jgi:hypothetical protein